MTQEHQERVWNLMAKKLSGEVSPEELQELERLLQDNPDLHTPAQVISELWQQTAPDDRQTAENAFDRHLARMKEMNNEGMAFPMARNRFGRGYWKILAGAAAVAAVTLGIIFALQHPDSHAPVADRAAGTVAKINSEISTRNGSKTHVVLPDGTMVWLNAGSRITYDKNYGGVLREVSLTGEAFFDVARNPEKPFLIHTARIDIKVLGTRFNVRSYPTDKTTEATLIRGSIEVSIKDRPSEKIILKPNEKLVVANDDSTLHRNRAGHNGGNTDESLVNIRKPTYEPVTGAVIETSWVDNKLIFQDQDFGELAASMERWYGVEIHFANAGLKEWHFTGSFQHETIQQALDALKLTADFYYKIDGDRVTIYEKK
jgi:ferric-dicitrate binding protein FerR (iron transport regulator)